MQSNLEKEGIKDRQETIVRNDYNKTDEYNVTHNDALSDGDAQGKGTGAGGHTFSVPDFSKSPTSFARQIDTENGGGDYDINGGPGGLRDNSGRIYLETINSYNELNQYGAGHPNAVSDGDVRGKGYGNGYTHYLPNYNASHTSPNYADGIKTNGGGGKYDIEGRPDLQYTGRNALTTMNLYGEGKAYYLDVKINTDQNVMDGQWKGRVTF